MTENEFKYFKNERMSYKHVFPLFEVAISDIEKVERVSVDIPVQVQSEKIFNLHQFEIFIKKERN